MTELSEHWEEIHQNKFHDVSWWQNPEELWIDLIEDLKIDKSSPIIDVGAGASVLINALHNLGYLNLAALDISNSALARLKGQFINKLPP